MRVVRSGASVQRATKPACPSTRAFQRTLNDHTRFSPCGLGFSHGFADVSIVQWLRGPMDVARTTMRQLQHVTEVPASQGKRAIAGGNCLDIEAQSRCALGGDTLSCSYPACLGTGLRAAGLEWRFSLIPRSRPRQQWLRQDLLTARGQEG
jgi:hypothetical protein